MRSRSLVIVCVVVLAAVGLVAGVAVAGADQSTTLPGITAPELLAKVGQAGGVKAVSGDISWHNGLFGDLSAAGDMAHIPAQSPLTSSGSGRIWVSDAGVRVESQGSGGDQVVVVSTKDRTAWVFDYAKNTAQKIVVTGEAPAETASPAPSATFLTPEAISVYLQRFARFASVEVAGQADVAGRDTYLLRMTPVADDTALGYVQAAIDGETMLPLRLEVVARGATAPVISFGFDTVSYNPVDGSRFEFTPPDGTTVKTETIDGDALREKMQQRHAGHEIEATKTGGDATGQHEELMRRVLLTREQVQALVPYELAWARGYEARPYRWGCVLGDGGPLTASGMPLMQLMGAATGFDELAPLKTHDSPADGPQVQLSTPSSVLLYGDGFGTIALAQTRTTADMEKQLKQLQKTSQILETVTIDGAQALVVGTPLGGAVIWQQGDSTLVAAGMVPMDDLKAFAGSVR